MNSLSNLLDQARAVADAGHETVTPVAVQQLGDELLGRVKTAVCYACARATIVAWPAPARRDRGASLGAGMTACSAGGVPASWYDEGLYQPTALFCSSFEPSGEKKSVGFD